MILSFVEILSKDGLFSEKSFQYLFSSLHRRGGNNPLILQNKFQDMADNVCEVRSTLVVHYDEKSTVSLSSPHAVEL